MKRIPVPPFDQTTGKCGPTALRSVLALYGVEATEDQLARAMGWTAGEGVPPKAIVDEAKSRGLAARAETGCTLNDLEEWAERGVPVIVDWDPHDEGVEEGSHYSVVVRVTDEDVELMDPEKGAFSKVARAKFDELWIRGRAIVVERQSPLKQWATRKLRHPR